MTQLIVSGLLIFSAVAEPRNSGKSTKFSKIHKNMQNTAKFATNPIHHIWNLSRLLGLFNCPKLANFSWNYITRTSKQHPKTTRRKLCCKKLGTSHDVKSFAIGSILERFVVKIAISSEIFSENSHQIDRFLTIVLRLS